MNGERSIIALELDKQLESQIMMKHYKGFLK